jgi:precorrin-2 C20-methyltransferase/precorrin-3B C17-methyltransferase
MIGRFWAIGVGPGDPELLTLKAARLIEQAQLIYHAGPAADQGRALAIIQHLLKPCQTVRTLGLGSMRYVSDDAYRPGVEAMIADCRQGHDVVFIAEGDPTLYSTASQVCQCLTKLDPEISYQIVPGVSSITAAAARVGWPLARHDEPLAIIPACHHTDNLMSLLDAFPVAALLKLGPALHHLPELLKDHDAVYVDELGTRAEFITSDLNAVRDRNRYFSLLLVRRRSTAVPPSDQRLGKLSVVGLGPGDVHLLTQQAREALFEAEVIVGYQAYLRLLEPLGLTAECRGTPLGAEADRAQLALDFARSGRRVALVSSGDAGVYGMASLLLETAGADSTVPIHVIPGISAMLAAAALLGAPLGHDFACISLSDLLTPWHVITDRLNAAGQGDFVVALYNPVSQRRTQQLPQAREILLRHRPATTPVGLVTRAHREGGTVRLSTLGELTTEGITMETIILIGNRSTRIINGRMVTPRGYGDRP